MANNDALQQQLIKDLLVESAEGLDRFDREILAIEKGEGTTETPNIVFRVIHTIKGTSGCLGLNKIESVAHVGENLLSAWRDGKVEVSPEMTTALFAYSDALREMLRCLETTGAEGSADYSDLLQQLQDLLDTTATPAPEAPAAPAGFGLFEDEPGTNVPAPQPDAEPVAKTVAPAESDSPASKAPSAAASAIRVDVGQLDKLMNLVGELVLARNQIVQYSGQAKDSALIAASQRLNIITTELQESVMKTRMQPIGNIWSKFPRVVRDVAHELGKDVQLVMEGQETELDRTIIEAIKDPLTHIVRNSIDHGIEKPEARAAAGKKSQGNLVLRAFHEGGQVNIEISDDGRGIDIGRIKQKAIEKGIANHDQISRMSDREAFNLIFLPGFSTAEKVTNVSGRGVGMDVVKTNIERIGGSVDILSENGKGTTLKIKIPLTLAIIPALIVTSGGERFAIPQVSLLELVRLEAEQARKGIETVYGAPVYRLRGQLLPLVFLNQTLAGTSRERAGGSGFMQQQAHDTGDLFLKAREAHRNWLRKLRQVLEGTQTMTLEEAGSHTLCALGKWIYADGLKKFGAVPEMQALEKVHQHFHDAVKEVVAQKISENPVKAEAAFKRATNISRDVFNCLTNAEKRIVENQNINIIVLQADGRQFGLVVDGINDTEEIVVKPLGKQLKAITCFAGATIMGDGKVALILDVLGLAQHAKVISEVRDHALLDKEESATRIDNRQTLLLFDAGAGSRMALPLSLVARLEEFPRAKVENSGTQEVVQYRGQILPLIQVSKYVTTTRPSEPICSDPMQVVVYSEQGRSVGLVVSKINDIVQETVTVKREAAGNGILGSAVIQNKVTDLVDIPAIIRVAAPAFYENHSPAADSTPEMQAIL